MAKPYNDLDIPDSYAFNKCERRNQAALDALVASRAKKYVAQDQGQPSHIPESRNGPQDHYWAQTMTGQPPQTAESEMSQNQAPAPSILGGLNLNIGPITDDSIVLSLHGVAAKRKDGSYTAFDHATGTPVDVTGMTFSANGLIYKLPARKVEVGDAVLYNGTLVFVREVVDAKTFKGIVANGDNLVEVTPRTNILGINFYTKVRALVDIFGGAAPAGAADGVSDDKLSKLLLFSAMSQGQGGKAPDLNNLLPLLLLGKGEGKADIDPMLLLMLTQNQGQAGGMNPLLLMALLK